MRERVRARVAGVSIRTPPAVTAFYYFVYPVSGNLWQRGRKRTAVVGRLTNKRTTSRGVCRARYTRAKKKKNKYRKKGFQTENLFCIISRLLFLCESYTRVKINNNKKCHFHAQTWRRRRRRRRAVHTFSLPPGIVVVPGAITSRGGWREKWLRGALTTLDGRFIVVIRTGHAIPSSSKGSYYGTYRASWSNVGSHKKAGCFLIFNFFFYFVVSFLFRPREPIEFSNGRKRRFTLSGLRRLTHFSPSYKLHVRDCCTLIFRTFWNRLGVISGFSPSRSSFSFGFLEIMIVARYSRN